MRKQYAKKRLTKITRIFAIKICKAHRTVSANASILLSGIIPLDMRVEECADLYKIKRGEPLHLLPDRPIEMRISSFLLPHPALRSRISYEVINTSEQVDEIPNNWPKLFTDGSKIEGKVGAAITWWENGRELRYYSLKLGNHCSVFQAELFAILHAVRILSRKATGLKANILSDSKSALQSIEDPKNLHPLVFEIRNTLEDLQRTNGEIKLFWVKAHTGIPGNERADEIAKKAALTKRTAPAYDALPVSSAKWYLRQETIDKWQIRYHFEQRGAVTKVFFPDIRLAYKTLSKVALNNQVAQLFTGHGGFGEYLHRFKLKSTSACTCDGSSPESIMHILCDCPRYIKARADAELIMGSTIEESNLSNLVMGDRSREVFLKFALSAVKIANRGNGSTSV